VQARFRRGLWIKVISASWMTSRLRRASAFFVSPTPGAIAKSRLRLKNFSHRRRQVSGLKKAAVFSAARMTHSAVTGSLTLDCSICTSERPSAPTRILVTTEGESVDCSQPGVPPGILNSNPSGPAWTKHGLFEAL